MIKKVAVVLVIASTTLMGGVGAASAAPKNGLTFEVTCPGGSFQVVDGSNNGAFSPVWGGLGKVNIPYEIHGTVTVDGVVVDEFHDIKPARVPATAVECEFAAEFEDGGHIRIAGTAIVVPRGPRG